nr:hypothetical protein Itr_chr10CG01690 [Ipomoea trifida]
METTLMGGGGVVVRFGYGERLSAVVGGAVDGRQWCGLQLATADSLHPVAFAFFSSQIIFFLLAATIREWWRWVSDIVANSGASLSGTRYFSFFCASFIPSWK